MAVTRLSGGTTPANGSDPRTFPTIWNATADVIEANITRADLPAGSVLQVVSSTHSSLVSTTSSSFQSTGLTATITPTSTSSKILILAHTNLRNSTGNTSAYLALFRGTTAGVNLGNLGRQYVNGQSISINHINIYDDPNTSSAQTYTLAFRADVSGNTVTAQESNAKASMTLMEVAG